MDRPVQLDPRRVWVDDEDCERLNRRQFEAVRCLLGAISYAAHAQDDLQDRLQCIPKGKSRMAMVLGGLRAIADDLLGGVTTAQCRQLKNCMNDMEMRMVPKLTRASTNVIFDQQVAKGIIDAAMEKCKGCVEDARSCRQCALYKVLEGITPLDTYDTLSCPYARSEWED